MILTVFLSIEEYGQKYMIRLSITKLGEQHHKRHRMLGSPQNFIIDQDLTFPPNFIFGCTSSSYQTEGLKPPLMISI